MRAAKVQASLRIRAVSPEPSLLAHTSSELRGTFRQKAKSLAPLNGWACAVKICHDGMLEDTNSLGGAQLKLRSCKITMPFYNAQIPGLQHICPPFSKKIVHLCTFFRYTLAHLNNPGKIYICTTLMLNKISHLFDDKTSFLPVILYPWLHKWTVCTMPIFPAAIQDKSMISKQVLPPVCSLCKNL